MSENSEYFLSFHRRELAPLYFKVKKIIIEAENFDPLKESYIAPFNEIRSTLDHIMKGAASENRTEMESNFVEAKVHLNRAGYDVYEILASNLGLAISQSIEKYPSSVISTIFPGYYNDIQPKIIEIQKGLSEVRSRKNVDGNGNPDSFDMYDIYKNELIEHYKTIQHYIPLLEKEIKRGWIRRIKENLLIILITLFTGIIIAAIIFLLGWN